VRFVFASPAVHLMMLWHSGIFGIDILEI
jgi:hypothetical protein